MGFLSKIEAAMTLGVSVEHEKKSARTPREERIIAGFEEIQKFAEENRLTDPEDLQILMQLLGMNYSSTIQRSETTGGEVAGWSGVAGQAIGAVSGGFSGGAAGSISGALGGMG